MEKAIRPLGDAPLSRVWKVGTTSPLYSVNRQILEVRSEGRTVRIIALVAETVASARNERVPASAVGTEGARGVRFILYWRRGVEGDVKEAV